MGVPPSGMTTQHNYALCGNRPLLHKNAGSSIDAGLTMDVVRSPSYPGAENGGRCSPASRSSACGWRLLGREYFADTLARYTRRADIAQVVNQCLLYNLPKRLAGDVRGQSCRFPNIGIMHVYGFGHDADSTGKAENPSWRMA